MTKLFFEFAVEQWFSWGTTESDLAGDIGAIEIWLIDWLIAESVAPI